jgi:hypothetical protein
VLDGVALGAVEAKRGSHVEPFSLHAMRACIEPSTIWPRSRP